MIKKLENFTSKLGKSLLNEKVLAAYNDALSFERTVSIVIPAVFAVVIFVGVLGNLSVIAVFSTKRRLHTSTNTLIINLALADLLFLVFCVPFTAADYALPIWVFSPNWCACLFYFQSVTAYASVWTLVLMALDRFFAVVYPIQSITLRNVRNTMAATVTLWLIILLSNLSQLEKFGIHEYTFVIEQRQACAYLDMVKGKAPEASVHWYFIGFSVFGYFVPLLLTSVLYIFLLHSLWSRKPHSLRSSTPTFAYMMPRQRLTNGRSAGGGCYLKTISESAKSKRKVTWMVTAVILTFAVCWLPLNVTFIQTALAYRRNRPVRGSKGQAIFMIFSQVLAYSNSCANPILYAFMSSNFRKGFSRMLSILTCKISTNWNPNTNNNNTNYNTTNNNHNNRLPHNQNYLLQNSLNTTNTVNNSNKNCGRKTGAENSCWDEEEDELGRFSPRISSNNVEDGFYQSGTSSTIILVAKSSTSSKQSLLVKRAPTLIIGASKTNELCPCPSSASKSNHNEAEGVEQRDLGDSQLIQEDDVLL